MLEFDEESKKAQVLAIHYAKQIGNDFVIGFMSSSMDISTADEAYAVAKVFWEMTDLAIDDNAKDVIVDGIADLEFWMYKLFNLVSGYLELNGYEKQWDQAKEAHQE